MKELEKSSILIKKIVPKMLRELSGFNPESTKNWDPDSHNSPTSPNQLYNCNDNFLQNKF